MLETARKAAEEVLLDQRLFYLDDAQYAAFLKVLDAPPRDLPELTEPAPWEK